MVRSYFDQKCTVTLVFSRGGRTSCYHALLKALGMPSAGHNIVFSLVITVIHYSLASLVIVTRKSQVTMFLNGKYE
jgi:hypothetical protein